MNKYTLILILVSQALSAGAPELKPIESVSPENHFKHTSGFPRTEIDEKGKKIIHVAEGYQVDNLHLLNMYYIFESYNSSEEIVLTYLVLGTEKKRAAKASDNMTLLGESYDEVIERTEVRLIYDISKETYSISQEPTTHLPSAYAWVVEP
jgi:hypothetical protein